MKIIILPATAYEQSLPALISLLGEADSANEIGLDFENVRFYTPGAIVILLAKVRWWVSWDKQVFFRNYSTCTAAGYLQRINFFPESGIEMPERFRRHDADGRFVELGQIGGEGAHNVEELSTGIADCVFPDANVDDPAESGLFDLIQYSVSELAYNVIHHSKSQGFAMAQYTATTDLIRVAIADTGIGVARSFTENGSPFWEAGFNDADAIALALRPKVSSKGHLGTAWGESINAGVGLTMLREFAASTDGNLFIASGTGLYWRKGANAVESLKAGEAHFPGTVCSVAFTRSKVRNFFELLQEAKVASGLLQGGENMDKFFS